jgi:hypothetical protein
MMEIVSATMHMKSSLLLLISSFFGLLFLFLELRDNLLVFLLVEKGGRNCIRREVLLWM